MKSTNSAIEEKINELMSMISNNGMASAPAQKRTAPTLQPSKRINIVDGENSDPLGYSEPTAHDSIEARGARARHSMKQMIEGHLAKRGPKPKTEHAPSINDFVVRSRAEILAAQKGEQSSSSAPATQVAQPVQPVQPVQRVQPQNTEVAADLIDDDDDDDAAYMDGTVHRPFLMCRACQDGPAAGEYEELTACVCSRNPAHFDSMKQFLK